VAFVANLAISKRIVMQKKGRKGRHSRVLLKSRLIWSSVETAWTSILSRVPVKLYIWIADSATTSHVSHEKSTFVDYMPVDEIVHGIGETPVKVEGRGTIILMSKAAINLLSVSRFEANGGTATIGHGKIVLRKRKGHVAINGNRLNGLYVLGGLA